MGVRRFKRSLRDTIRVRRYVFFHEYKLILINFNDNLNIIFVLWPQFFFKSALRIIIRRGDVYRIIKDTRGNTDRMKIINLKKKT